MVDERARLAAEQADRVEMQNAVTRGELVPAEDVTVALADNSRQIAAALDAVPALIKRRVPNVGGKVLEIVRAEIDKARKIAANVDFSPEIIGIAEGST